MWQWKPIEIPHEELLSHMIILPNNTGISLIKNSLFADLSNPPINKATRWNGTISKEQIEKQYFKNHTKINSINLVTMYFALSSVLELYNTAADCVKIKFMFGH